MPELKKVESGLCDNCHRPGLLYWITGIRRLTQERVRMRICYECRETLRQNSHSKP